MQHRSRKGIKPVPFSADTLKRMDDVFRINAKPSANTLVQLQRETGDELERIRKWFRDRRYEHRKRGLPEDGMAHPAHVLEEDRRAPTGCPLWRSNWPTLPPRPRGSAEST